MNQKKARWFFSSRIMETKCIQRRKIQMDCANNALFSSLSLKSLYKVLSARSTVVEQVTEKTW